MTARARPADLLTLLDRTNLQTSFKRVASNFGTRHVIPISGHVFVLVRVYRRRGPRENRSGRGVTLSAAHWGHLPRPAPHLASTDGVATPPTPASLSLSLSLSPIGPDLIMRGGSGKRKGKGEGTEGGELPGPPPC